MNNDYMNDEMEIDLIELLKHLLRNIKTILVVTLVCGLITFGVTQFILPKRLYFKYRYYYYASR